MSVRFVEVAVPVPYLPLLTYRVPQGMTAPLAGARVRVPLGSRIVTGVVVSQTPGGPGGLEAQGEDGVRDVIEVVDDTPFLPPAVLGLALWVAEYYACGPGDAISAAMPPMAGVRPGRGPVRSTAFKTVRVARVAEAGQASGDERLGQRQREALELLRQAPDGLDVKGLSEHGIQADALRRLADRGLIHLERRPIERDPFSGSGSEAWAGSEHPAVGRLTPEQDRVLELLLGLAETGGFRVALLHGVTGSGKTEVYVRLAEAVRRRGRRVLVLVPEIALAPAVARAFRSVFGARVAIQHSGLSDGERHDQWHRIKRGDVDIVVGTRSAVFAPLENLGLIVVDEEHDASYKQDETPRYHARDAAVIRGRTAGALVVLGSATPSMESYQNATSGRYTLVTMTARVLQRPLPDVRIVDMREELATRGGDVALSQPLLEALASRVTAGEQSLLLLNRRGYATAVLCRQCGQTLECPNCSVTLTLHRSAGRVRCHYCNYSRARPRLCPHCAGPYLERVGFGTERIEMEVRDALPDATVARLDRDTVRRRGAAGRVLERFGRGEIDVLVGTQMIAKGHDFPAVTLVGVVSADVGLGLADFRAAERTFQLLTQVAGRAGRGDRRGEAVIQTFYPEHYSIGFACRQAYAPFFEAELRFRRGMRYPPIVAMVNAIVRSGSLQSAMRDAATLVGELRGRPGFEVLGPAPAPIQRVKGEYRVQFFLKGTHRPAMRVAIQEAVARHPTLQRRVAIDVDPLTVL